MYDQDCKLIEAISSPVYLFSFLTLFFTISSYFPRVHAIQGITARTHCRHNISPNSCITSFTGTLAAHAWIPAVLHADEASRSEGQPRLEVPKARSCRPQQKGNRPMDLKCSRIVHCSTFFIYCFSRVPAVHQATKVGEIDNSSACPCQL